MISISPQLPRWRIDLVSYETLRQLVLRRNGWRCQSCGTMSNLEVHHQQFRSHSGNDSAENLITLCMECHARVHGERQSPCWLTRVAPESTRIASLQVQLDRSARSYTDTPTFRLQFALTEVFGKEIFHSGTSFMDGPITARPSTGSGELLSSQADAC